MCPWGASLNTAVMHTLPHTDFLSRSSPTASFTTGRDAGLMKGFLGLFFFFNMDPCKKLVNMQLYEGFISSCVSKIHETENAKV